MLRHDASRSLSVTLATRGCPRTDLAFGGSDGLCHATRHDRAKVEELWNPMLKAWFPEGLETPDLRLIKVHAETAECWCGRERNRAVVAGRFGSGGARRLQCACGPPRDPGSAAGRPFSW
ncbi:pyridoxamine 5'-phosphate oxidase family protein [Actinoplanes sp. NPDC049599]|uniref:pyridoxamine 5'-phosphate oxidase family protein n=1 Tax=Actinoplanes sp. NPDC049599 TaxID=3363903 RepID=UPI0037AB662E